MRWLKKIGDCLSELKDSKGNPLSGTLSIRISHENSDEGVTLADSIEFSKEIVKHIRRNGNGTVSVGKGTKPIKPLLKVSVNIICFQE